MTHPDHLSDDDTATLRQIRRRDPDIDRLTRHVRAFAAMMTGRHGDRLDNWITHVEHDSLPSLASFARNLRRDYDAVRNGLSMPCNSGPVEGSINRIILWNQFCQVCARLSSSVGHWRCAGVSGTARPRACSS